MTKNMKEKLCAVYIMTNQYNSVFYTGVTSNLPKRVYEHKTHLDPRSFTSRYNLEKLVWYDTTPDMIEAIQMEKRIKGWLRKKKIELVESTNPEWEDLSNSL
jgi:putative endonuclease